VQPEPEEEEYPEEVEITSGARHSYMMALFWKLMLMVTL
jgi:hypothetical protein